MAYVRKNLNEVIAGMPAVQARVHAVAIEGEGRIKAAIAPHTKTGRLISSVHVERANRFDYWIHVTAPYAVPLNYGFKHNWTGKHIEGINFIKAAIYG
jgi:hypothetical protein